MSDFSELVDTINRNPKGRWKAGAKMHRIVLYDRRIEVTISSEQLERLDVAKGKLSRSQKIREFIEWGLENEE